MERTTKPDKYSAKVKLALVLWRSGVITPKEFNRRIRLVWSLRHA